MSKKYEVQRSVPWKNNASMPGPTWAPENGSWGQIISCFGLAMALTFSASAWASSKQSPWEMATI